MVFRKNTFYKVLIVYLQFQFWVGGLYGQICHPLSTGFNWYPDCLFADTSTNLLYAGGLFTQAGSITAQSITRWNGTAWDSLKNNLGGGPRCMLNYKGEMYFSGGFSIYDTTHGHYTPYSSIIKWDTVSHNWIDIDTMFIGNVWSMIELNNELVVGGNFDSIGGISSKLMARYDGTNWYGYPPLTNMQGGIISLESYNGDIYVGGSFSSQVIGNKDDIPKWNGTQWMPVSNGLSGAITAVYTMKVFQGKLIVGGYFHTNFGDPGNFIVAWDGVAWSQLSTGLDGNVRALQIYNNELWVGGSFTDAGGTSVTNIAKWDGIQWHAVGINLNGTVTSLAVIGNDLFIGGAFTTINGIGANYVARYNPTTGLNSLTQPKPKVEIFPTLAHNTIKFTYNTIIQTTGDVKIYNSTGQIVYNACNINLNHAEFNVSHLPPGVYHLRAYTKDGEGGARFIKE